MKSKMMFMSIVVMALSAFGCSSVSKVGTTAGNSDLFETSCFGEPTSVSGTLMPKAPEQCLENAHSTCKNGFAVKTLTSSTMTGNGANSTTFNRMEFVCSNSYR